jgi:hypothetical protein
MHQLTEKSSEKFGMTAHSLDVRITYETHNDLTVSVDTDVTFMGPFVSSNIFKSVYYFYNSTI